MNKPVLAIIAVVVLAAAAYFLFRPGSGGPEPDLHPVGPYAVGVRNEPSPPRTGENVLRVTIDDARGRAIRGANVGAVVSMPAMGAMPYMESRGRVEATAPGQYRVAYGLAMPGEWDIVLRITAPGAEPAEGRWRLSTHLPDVAFAGGEAEAADTAGGGAPGTIVLDEARRQAIGVRTAKVELRDMTAPVRARGTVVYDETARAVVSMRYSGWVRTLAADFTGKPVGRGDVLFTVDSPEIVAAQQEYLTALKFASADSSAHAVSFGSGAGSTLSLADAARQRLLSWGLTPDQVERVARTGRPLDPLPVRAPIGGVVLDKAIVAGSPFTPGQVLLSIARVDPVWIEARVSESDLPLVHVGTPATIEGGPGGTAPRKGVVRFLAPALDEASRTGVARIQLSNPGGALRPGMFVDVSLDAPLGRRLVVPEGAVVPTGTRQVVFVDLGGGRLEPREVTIGPRAGGMIAIEHGLAEGETIVASGNFLVAADARLRSALGKW